MIPKPLQKPHPPIRLAANSVDTFAFAGEHGYPIFAGGPVNPIPVLGERLVIYKDALTKAGKQAPDDWLAAALMVQVGRDRASVRATIEPSLQHYFHFGRRNHRAGEQRPRASGAVQDDAGSLARGSV